MKVPQEIFEYIIMLSDTNTIIKNRHLLSNYTYIQSLNYPLANIIKYTDLEALKYKIISNSTISNTLFNKIILLANDNNILLLLNFCYNNDIRHDFMTLHILLCLKDSYNKINTILNILYKNNYKFYLFHYYLAIELKNTIFMDFLYSINIIPDTCLINEIISSEDFELFLWLYKYNLYTYHNVLYKVVKTFNKEYIKSCLKYIPLHTVHWTVKQLKNDNIDYEFILWVLINCLIEDHSLFRNNYLNFI